MIWIARLVVFTAGAQAAGAVATMNGNGPLWVLFFALSGGVGLVGAVEIVARHHAQRGG